MKPIAHLPASKQARMIDLTRSLKLPHGSLTPNTDPEPRWRIEARRDAEEFQRATLITGIAFLLFVGTLLGYYLARA